MDLKTLTDQLAVANNTNTDDPREIERNELTSKIGSLELGIAQADEDLDEILALAAQVQRRAEKLKAHRAALAEDYRVKVARVAELDQELIERH